MVTTPDRQAPRLLVGLLCLYVLLVVVLLLFPRSDLPSSTVVIGTRLALAAGGDPSLVTEARMEVALNVVLMIPLALLGRILRPAYSWRDWTAVGFVVATGVELVQGLLLPERSASALDVVANTTGVALGAIAGSILRSRRPRTIPDTPEGAA